MVNGSCSYTSIFYCVEAAEVRKASPSCVCRGAAKEGASEAARALSRTTPVRKLGIRKRRVSGSGLLRSSPSPRGSLHSVSFRSNEMRLYLVVCPSACFDAHACMHAHVDAVTRVRTCCTPFMAVHVYERIIQCCESRCTCATLCARKRCIQTDRRAGPFRAFAECPRQGQGTGARLKGEGPWLAGEEGRAGWPRGGGGGGPFRAHGEGAQQGQGQDARALEGEGAGGGGKGGVGKRIVEWSGAALRQAVRPVCKLTAHRMISMLRVEIPGALLMFWGISPLEDEIQIESNPSM